VTPVESATVNEKMPSVTPALMLPCASGSLVTRQIAAIPERRAMRSATIQ
jgi:hypothetical protein